MPDTPMTLRSTAATAERLELAEQLAASPDAHRLVYLETGDRCPWNGIIIDVDPVAFKHAPATDENETWGGVHEGSVHYAVATSDTTTVVPFPEITDLASAALGHCQRLEREIDRMLEVYRLTNDDAFSACDYQDAMADLLRSLGYES